MTFHSCTQELCAYFCIIIFGDWSSYSSSEENCMGGCIHSLYPGGLIASGVCGILIPLQERPLLSKWFFLLYMSANSSLIDFSFLNVSRIQKMKNHSKANKHIGRHSFPRPVPTPLLSFQGKMLRLHWGCLMCRCNCLALLAVVPNVAEMLWIKLKGLLQSKKKSSRYSGI